MSESAFDGQILSDKLSKVDSSQKSIESTSKWCISHRKKARQIVEAWDKLFKAAQKEQRVAFLFLSNDILQNSRRKGSEFVNEFWKVLPATLKSVYESGEESGKKAASRLVDIWEERKVFGSRGQNLKNDLMGIKPISSPTPTPAPPPLPPSASIGKSPNPIKIVKRDSLSLRIKLVIGCMPEKIVTGFHSVLDENVNEEASINKCKDAVNRVGEIEKNVEIMSAQGNVQGSGLVGDIQEAEKILKQCATQLESAEVTRSALVSRLKEALQDQESELELIRSRLKVVQRNIEQATNIKEMLTSEPPRASPQSQSMMSSFSGTKASEDESKKAAAAAMAAKLTASTSSVEMLSSVLSSFVAKEAAASLSSGLQPPRYSTIFSPEKRQKLEKPMAVPPSSDGQNYQPPPSNSPTNHQFQQSTGLMMGIPYGYAASGNLPPPPPPLPSHVSVGLSRPSSALQRPLSPQQQQQQQQQQSGGSGYYRPPGIGFYGQSQQTPPPVPRQ